MSDTTRKRKSVLIGDGTTEHGPLKNSNPAISDYLPHTKTNFPLGIFPFSSHFVLIEFQERAVKIHHQNRLHMGFKTSRAIALALRTFAPFIISDLPLVWTTRLFLILGLTAAKNVA